MSSKKTQKLLEKVDVRKIIYEQDRVNIDKRVKELKNILKKLEHKKSLSSRDILILNTQEDFIIEELRTQLKLPYRNGKNDTDKLIEDYKNIYHSKLCLKFQDPEICFVNYAFEGDEKGIKKSLKKNVTNFTDAYAAGLASGKENIIKKYISKDLLENMNTKDLLNVLDKAFRRIFDENNENMMINLIEKVKKMVSRKELSTKNFNNLLATLVIDHILQHEKNTNLVNSSNLLKPWFLIKIIFDNTDVLLTNKDIFPTTVGPLIYMKKRNMLKMMNKYEIFKNFVKKENLDEKVSDVVFNYGKEHYKRLYAESLTLTDEKLKNDILIRISKKYLKKFDIEASKKIYAKKPVVSKKTISKKTDSKKVADKTSVSKKVASKSPVKSVEPTEECKKYLANPSVNPKTGKGMYKKTYEKYVNDCVKTQSVQPQSGQTQSVKTKNVSKKQIIKPMSVPIKKSVKEIQIDKSKLIEGRGGYTVLELKNIAKEKKIDIKGLTKKVDIVKKIKITL